MRSRQSAGRAQSASGLARAQRGGYRGSDSDGHATRADETKARDFEEGAEETGGEDLLLAGSHSGLCAAGEKPDCDKLVSEDSYTTTGGEWWWCRIELNRKDIIVVDGLVYNLVW